MTVLTGTGATIWDLFDHPRSREDVVAELAVLYGTTESELSADLAQLLDDLARRGILEHVDP